MFPLGGHSCCDGMFAVTDLDDELVLRAVASSSALVCVPNQLVAFVIVYIRAMFFCSSSPASEANHFIIFQPVRERVVGSVNTNETTAGANIFLESGLYLFRPVLTIVVADYYIKIGKRWAPLSPVLGGEFAGSFFCSSSLFFRQISWCTESGGSGRGGDFIAASLFVLAASS